MAIRISTVGVVLKAGGEICDKVFYTNYFTQIWGVRLRAQHKGWRRGAPLGYFGAAQILAEATS
jgi:hypothetical protein